MNDGTIVLLVIWGACGLCSAFGYLTKHADAGFPLIFSGLATIVWFFSQIMKG